MSPFGIFTIVLISLYAVYYAVLISREIYGKKNAARQEEEEFDISSLQEEDAAVGVEESDNGFSLTPLRKGETVVNTTASSGFESSTTNCKSATQEKIDKVQEEMDEIAPIGNLTMSKEFFRDLLLQANLEGSLFTKKKQVPAV